LRDTGFLQALQHKFGYGLMRLEVPMDAVRIASAAHDVLGDSGLQVDERNAVLLRPFGDRLDGARPAVVCLAVGFRDVH
jgi:hypothetical protein